MAFQKATKKQARLRAALFGPSGSGKTYTALQIATGIGGSIAVIDTERGSASKYADRFQFDVCDLENRGIDGYVATINEAAAAGYAVLIIDSLTHGWQELLTEVEKLAQTKYRGNTWSAWSEGTPRQRKLVDALLQYPGHVLATMRSKTEWTTEKDRNGKDRPVRVGLAPEQGKGIEYEFDMLFEMSVDHIVTVIKDRSGKFQDRMIEKPSPAFGAEMAAWLADGVDSVAELARGVSLRLRDLGVTGAGMHTLLSRAGGEGCTNVADLPEETLQKLLTGTITPEKVAEWNGPEGEVGQGPEGEDEDAPLLWQGAAT